MIKSIYRNISLILLLMILSLNTLFGVSCNIEKDDKQYKLVSSSTIPSSVSTNKSRWTGCKNEISGVYQNSLDSIPAGLTAVQTRVNSKVYTKNYLMDAETATTLGIVLNGINTNRDSLISEMIGLAYYFHNSIKEEMERDNELTMNIYTLSVTERKKEAKAHLYGFLSLMILSSITLVIFGRTDITLGKYISLILLTVSILAIVYTACVVFC